MADAVLSFVLEQFSTLLREESALLGELRDEVQHIRDELGQMKGFLRGAESVLEDNPNLKEWISQVRDAAYDAEDVVDEFILRFGGHQGRGFVGRVRKVSARIRNLKSRHQLATELHTINDRIKRISETHERYKTEYGNIGQGSSNVGAVQNTNKSTWHDSRGDALLLEEEDLVGIERSKEKLINMISTSHDSPLHVVAVVGMGGLGKTTLVKKVYDDAVVKNRFKHHLWITVSQTFNIETLLKDAIRKLFKELNQPAPEELEKMDIISMKQCVLDTLRREKFIVVFDDVWRTTDWDALRIAFPKNNNGSTIIVTTRNAEVGQAAKSDTSGEVYPLERLSEEESWKLFCKKVFQANSCPDQFEKISRKIIERCGGLPLAIVVIGGALARKNQEMEKWELFSRSLSEQLAEDDQLSNMMKILSFSYFDLPDHLRTCLLYLSILPEDVSIRKTRLVRLWIAEGFVQGKQGMTVEEVAETYLHELINRSLVQISKRAVDGRVKACNVHDLILQFIIRKAKEHDITTIFCEQMMQSSNKVRRLVIHQSSGNRQVSDELFKCVRSLVLFEPTTSMSKPFLSTLLSPNVGVLKVLDLEGSALRRVPNGIFKFLHLKYLSFRGTNVETIPKLIGKLQKLETLDLTHTYVERLPVEILKLQQLQHLLVRHRILGVGFKFGHKIGNLQCLQSLDRIDVKERREMNIVKEIGKLTQLRKLRIENLRSEDGEELCSSIEKLTNLRSLRLSFHYEEEVMDLGYPVSSTPQFLYKLNLVGKLEKLPQWIVSLRALTKLTLSWTEMRDDEPLALIEDLPNLVQLTLVGDKREGLCFKATKFQKLKILYIKVMEELRWVRVEKGAMPFLQQLSLEFCISMEELPEGIEYLTSLQTFEIWGMSDMFVKKVEEDKEKIAHIHTVVIHERVNGKYQSRYL